VTRMASKVEGGGIGSLLTPAQGPRDAREAGRPERRIA
jgi:hypothetical protein